MIRTFAIFFTFTAGALAQAPFEKIPIHNLRDGDTIGPFVLRKIEPEHAWITVNLLKDSQIISTNLEIQLDCIRPARSRDAKKQQLFQQIFVEGVRILLSKNRRFWFVVTNDYYAGPGQIGGIFRLDDNTDALTLQYEMVRCGYAVVSGSSEWTKVGEYHFDFRDKLLRTEGMAKAWKLGLWSLQQ